MPREAATKARALAIGPGLGRDAAAKALRDELIASGDQSLVLDADALHELEPGDWGARAVLTPHAGELGRLLGESSAWVDAHRLEAARRCAERFGCVCLLKGADTIVAGPGEGALVVLAEAPGLATAGTGDVLTGILAAFLAKGLEPRLAAAAAATAHGLARADAAAARSGRERRRLAAASRLQRSRLRGIERCAGCGTDAPWRHQHPTFIGEHPTVRLSSTSARSGGTPGRC